MSCGHTPKFVGDYLDENIPIIDMVEGKVAKARTLVEGRVSVLRASCYLEEWMSRFESKPYPSGGGSLLLSLPLPLVVTALQVLEEPTGCGGIVEWGLIGEVGDLRSIINRFA